MACHCCSPGAITRRSFLATGSAALAGLLTAGPVGSALAQTAGIIDIHHHVSPPSFITAKPLSNPTIGQGADVGYGS